MLMRSPVLIIALSSSRGAKSQMPAMIHDEDAVADLLDLLHVMAGVDHRRAFAVKSLDTFENRIAALWIDGHGRLVEKIRSGLWAMPQAILRRRSRPPDKFRRTIGTVIAQSYEIQRLVHEHATFCLVGNMPASRNNRCSPSTVNSLNTATFCGTMPIRRFNA